MILMIDCAEKDDLISEVSRRNYPRKGHEKKQELKRPASQNVRGASRQGNTAAGQGAKQAMLVFGSACELELRCKKHGEQERSKKRSTFFSNCRITATVPTTIPELTWQVRACLLPVSICPSTDKPHVLP